MTDETLKYYPKLLTGVNQGIRNHRLYQISQELQRILPEELQKIGSQKYGWSSATNLINNRDKFLMNVLGLTPSQIESINFLAIPIIQSHLENYGV